MVDSSPSSADDVDALCRQIAELRTENDRLRGLLGVGTRDEAVSPWEPTLFVEAEGNDSCAPVDRNSPRDAKVALFRSLFVGRDDVHAVRCTGHSIPEPDGVGIQEVFRGVVEDGERTRQICGDILMAVDEGRKCLVLTQWTEHVESIANALRDLGLEPFVLYGGMPKKRRAAAVERLNSGSPDHGLLLVATGASSVRASTVLRWTRCSWRSHWLSRAASSSTWGGCCGRWRRRPASRSTTMSTSTYLS